MGLLTRLPIVGPYLLPGLIGGLLLLAGGLYVRGNFIRADLAAEKVETERVRAEKAKAANDYAQAVLAERNRADQAIADGRAAAQNAEKQAAVATRLQASLTAATAEKAAALARANESARVLNQLLLKRGTDADRELSPDLLADIERLRRERHRAPAADATPPALAAPGEARAPARGSGKAPRR